MQTAAKALQTRHAEAQLRLAGGAGSSARRTGFCSLTFFDGRQHATMTNVSLT